MGWAGGKPMRLRREVLPFLLMTFGGGLATDAADFREQQRTARLEPGSVVLNRSPLGALYEHS